MQQQAKPIFAPIATIPDDMTRLADEQQLGGQVEDYTVLKLPRGWRWFALAIWIVLCGDALTLCVALPLLALLLFSSTINTQLDSLSQLIVLPLIFSHLVFSILRMILNNYHLYAYEKGLILKQSAKKRRVIRWDEIRTIRTTFTYTPTSFFKRHCVYSLHCYDGYTLAFSAARYKLPELEILLEEQFTRPRLSLALSDYQAGQTLHFGPLHIQRDGIAIHDKILPWEQISEIVLQQQYLLIKQLGNPAETWLKLSSFRVPNLALLLALCRQIRTGQESAPATLSSVNVNSQPATVMSNNRWIDSLPEEMAALAQEYKLGERRVDAGLGLKRGVPLWIFLLGYAIMDGFFLGFVLLLHFLFSILISPGMPDGIELLPWFLLGSIGVLNVIPLCSVLWHLSHATYTFEKGLIFKSGRRAPGVYRWDEIDSIQDTLLFQKYFFYWTTLLPNAHIFQKRDGSHLLLSNIDINSHALTALVKEQIVPLQLQKALAAYEDGQTLTFGPLHINQAGITLEHRQITWPQVRSVGLQKRDLVIYTGDQQKPWWRTSTTRVPNLPVLFALADHARSRGAVISSFHV